MCKSYLIDKWDKYDFIYYCSIGTNILSLLLSFLESQFVYSKNTLKTEQKKINKWMNNIKLKIKLKN